MVFNMIPCILNKADDMNKDDEDESRDAVKRGTWCSRPCDVNSASICLNTSWNLSIKYMAELWVRSSPWTESSLPKTSGSKNETSIVQWTTIIDGHTLPGMASQEDKTNILGNPSTGDVRYGSLGPIHQGNFTVYKRRWYILLIFCICSATNALKWNTWGPIQGTCQVVFGWSNTTITMLVTWSPIVSVVVFLPMSWLMDVKGEKTTNWQHYRSNCFPSILTM